MAPAAAVVTEAVSLPTGAAAAGTGSRWPAPRRDSSSCLASDGLGARREFSTEAMVRVVASGTAAPRRGCRV